jgi:hypothetical protein
VVVVGEGPRRPTVRGDQVFQLLSQEAQELSASAGGPATLEAHHRHHHQRVAEAGGRVVHQEDHQEVVGQGPPEGTLRHLAKLTLGELQAHITV